MKIDRIDHLVLTVASIDATCDFYSRVLGMNPVTFAGGRKALSFGRHKINLHQSGDELLPNAFRPTPGSGDFCLIVDDSLDDVIAHLESVAVPIEKGPVVRTGATGPIRSIYLRDPDNNLIELSEYITAAP